MNIWPALSEFFSSFGVSTQEAMSLAKLMPFIIMFVALFGFIYSNYRHMQQQAHARIAQKLRRAGADGNRGLSYAELAKRIAPETSERGARKAMVDLAEMVLKLAKFDRKETEKKLIQSGDRDPRAISRYILQRGAGMALAPTLAWFFLPHIGFTGALQVVASLTCVLAGGIVVDVRLDKALKARRDRIAGEFPVLLDLLTIYLEAGQAFDTALARAAKSLKESFPTAAEEVEFLRQDLELSIDREKTLREFSTRLSNPTAVTFISIVIQAERRGNPIAPSLRVLARESRKDVIAEIERKAQKLPTLMQGPMFLLILPSIFLSVIGPAIIQILIEFGGR